ncbi:MAG: formylglycine-generating enzyme family protein [Kiritimatiellae bacterium]|nr:formylglycine-generating enzyme family protein [Kiritimatiellia bacterium]
MKHKQNAMWRLAICLMAVGCVGLAEPFAIESFDGTGQLTFTAPDDGTNYLCQVEWAPSPAGPWSSFEGAGKEWLDAIRAVSGGAVTSSVPMCYRVVASPGDYLVVDLSGGVMAGSWPVAYYRSLRDVPDGQQHVRYKTTHLLLRRIRKGVAMMGRHPDDYWYGAGESPRHPVTLTRDFYIGVYEVTQRQWEQVMVTNPSFYTNALYSATRPVEQVNYYAIRENAAANSAISPNWPQSAQVHESSFMGVLQSKTGLAFDLPTEAQWEYACRAGTDTSLNSGKNLIDSAYCPNMAEVGRYIGNRGSLFTYQYCTTEHGTAEVGSYLPNAWGLYDMHGNVSEWCLDWYGGYPDSAIDPVGALTGDKRIRRGGGFLEQASACRSARRIVKEPDFVYYSVGFRVSLTP